MYKILESKYTMELRYFIEDSNFKLFDFDYEFYDKDLKPIFEKKFIDYYYFNEIGSETIGRFKHMLKSHLNTIMPYYTQLYKTEIESKDKDFLLNKDLKETFIRSLQGSNEASSKNEGNTTSNNESNSNSNNQYKESNLNNGIANLKDDNITNINSNINNLTDLNKNVSSSIDESTNKNLNNEEEKTELISKGNIGITSTAELLEKWRKCIINIMEEVIESCYDLFMLIY